MLNYSVAELRFMTLISDDKKGFLNVLKRFVSKTSSYVKSVELSIFD